MPFEKLNQQLVENPGVKSGLIYDNSAINYGDVSHYSQYSKPNELYNNYLLQTNWESLGNTLVRGGAKFLLSVPEMTGNVVGWLDSSADFDNGLSAWARAQKEAVDEAYPEYSKMFEEGFDPGDIDWWFRNGDSIIESAGYMALGAGIGRGVVGLTRMLGATANAAKTTGVLTSAVAMNYGEGVQMAGHRYRELIDAGVSKEEASKAAANIVMGNTLNLPLQILESKLLLQGLAGTRSMASLGVKASAKDVGKQFLQEGFEEWNQGFIEEEAVRAAKIKEGKMADDGSTPGQRLAKYAFSDDALTQALIGAVGGGGTQIVSNAAMNLDPKYREQKQKALAQINSNYSTLIDTALKVGEIQKKKDFASSEKDDVAFDHATREQAFEVAVSNARLGTFEQFLKTFEAFGNMTEEEATAKGLNKADIKKMQTALKPVIEQVERTYGRLEAEFGKIAGPEFVQELAKTAFYGSLHGETAAKYETAAEKKTLEAAKTFKPRHGAIATKLNTLYNKHKALVEIKEAAEETLRQDKESEIAKHILNKVDKDIDVSAREIEAAHTEADQLYPGEDVVFETPFNDLDVQKDIYKATRHGYMSEYYNGVYKELNSKKKIEELKNKQAEKAATKDKEKIGSKLKDLSSPFDNAVKEAVATKEYRKGEKKPKSENLANIYESLKKTDAYANASEKERAAYEADFTRAVKAFERAAEVDEVEEERLSKDRNVRVKKLNRILNRRTKALENLKKSKKPNAKKIQALEEEIATLNDEKNLLNQKLNPQSLDREIRKKQELKSVIEEVEYTPAQTNEEYFESAMRRYRKQLGVLDANGLHEELSKVASDLLNSRKNLWDLRAALARNPNADILEEIAILEMIVANNNAKLQEVQDALVLVETQESQTGGVIILEEVTATAKAAARLSDVEAAFKSVEINDISEDGRVITIRGKQYTNEYSDPIQAINRNKEGEIISITLTDAKGKSVTFSNEMLVDELAYSILSIEAAKVHDLEKSVVVTSQVNEVAKQIEEKTEVELDTLKADLLELLEIESTVRQKLQEELDYLRSEGLTKKAAEELMKTSNLKKELEEVKGIVKEVKKRIKEAEALAKKEAKIQHESNTKITAKPAVESSTAVEDTANKGTEQTSAEVSEEVIPVPILVTEELQAITGEEDIESQAEVVNAVLGETAEGAVNDQSPFDVRKKDNIQTLGYKGQEYETVQRGDSVLYQDVYDEDGNPVVVSLPDTGLNDYKQFTPGQELEIVLDTEWAKNEGIPINEENLHRIPFGIRRPGMPITAHVHRFESPVTEGSPIDAAIKRLIREPVINPDGSVAEDVQAREQERLLKLRKFLFNKLREGGVVSAKVSGRKNGYTLVSEYQPSVQQLGIDGKIADDIDFATIIHGNIHPFSTKLPITTQGRRREDGSLVFPEGALLVLVPGYDISASGETILEPEYVQANQVSEEDADVIMHVLGRQNPMEAVRKAGAPIKSLSDFLNNFVYSGENSGQLHVTFEKDAATGTITSYMYTLMLTKKTKTSASIWDKRSRIRIWTNDANSPITEQEKAEAKGALMHLYYNFPKSKQDYSQFAMENGELVFKGQVPYKQHVLNNTKTKIHGKHIPGTNRKQFFAQSVVAMSVAGFDPAPNVAPVPAAKKKVSVSVVPQAPPIKTGTATRPSFEEVMKDIDVREQEELSREFKGIDLSQKSIDIIAERTDARAIAFIEKYDSIRARYEEERVIERNRQEAFKGNIVEEVKVYSIDVRGKQYEIYEEKYDKNSSEYFLYVKRENGEVSSVSREDEKVFNAEGKNKKFLRDETSEWIDTELQAKINAEYDAKIAALKKGVSETTTTAPQAAKPLQKKSTIVVPVTQEVQKTVETSTPVTSYYSGILGFKETLLQEIKKDPVATLFTILDTLESNEQKAALKKAYATWKSKNQGGDVQEFIRVLAKDLKNLDPLIAAPLGQRNHANVQAMHSVSTDKKAVYETLTETTDPEFNEDMRNLMSVIGDFTVVPVNGESAYLGLADSKTDRIYLFADNVARTSRSLATILGHEVVHLATSQALENPTNANEKAFSNNINAVFKKVQKTLGKEAGANAKEFLAEFYSNRDFREKLNTIEEGLFEKIWAWIKELFGFKSKTLEQLVREYTNTFVKNFEGYDRTFAKGSDPLYADYVDSGISLSRREMLVTSLTGETLKYLGEGVLDAEVLKERIRQSLTEAKDYAANDEAREVLDKVLNDATLFDVVFTDVKNTILRLDVGYDERESWQVESRFEVSPWSTTSKQVRKFLASVPEQRWEDGELYDVVNELGLTVYKNPIALHSNLAETLAGKNVMQHLAYLAGYNQFGVVYDPVKRYIYHTLIGYQNSNNREYRQAVNAFKTDFKKYKAEFVSAKHKLKESMVESMDSDMVAAKEYSFELYESNKTGVQSIVSQWYNSFNNKMTADGIVDTNKTSEIYRRFSRINDVKTLSAEELHNVLADYGINMSVGAIHLALTAPHKVVKKMTTQRFLAAINNIIRTSTLPAPAEAYGENHPFIRGEESNIKLLAKFESQVNSNSFSSLFRTESGKNMYAISNNTMLFETEQALKEGGANGLLVQRLSIDPFSANSLLLQEIKSGQEFDIKIFSEFVNQKREPNSFRDLTDQERRLVKIAGFINRNSTSALIQFPTLEAKPVIPFLKANKIKVTLEDGKIDDGTVQLMYNIVLSEYNRIQNVKREQKELEQDDLIETYHFSGRDENGRPKFSAASGLKFHLTPIMNTFEVDGVKVKDMEQDQFENAETVIKERLKNYATEKINEEWSSLVKLGIAFNVNNSLKIKPEFVDGKALSALGQQLHGTKVKATHQEFVANMVMNYYVRQADIFQVLAWDIAYVKGHIDMSKRLAALIAPGVNLDTVVDEDASKAVMKLMVLKDEYRTSPMIANWTKAIEFLQERHKHKIKIDPAAALSGILNQNTTDGQSWVGINYKRDELNSLGRLTEEVESTLEAAEYGEDITPENMPIGSSKIVYANKVWDGTKFKFVYIKTSTNTVLPGVHRQDLVDATNKADIVAHTSAVKAGAQGVGSGKTQDITRDGLRLQQEITYHGDDTSITALSQARRMLTEGFLDVVFKDLRLEFDGKNLDVMSFRNQFQRLHMATVANEWDKLSEVLGVELTYDYDNKPVYSVTNMSKLRDYLINSGRLTDSEVELLQTVNGRFEIPLYFSPSSERFESIMFSIISNKIMSIEQEGSSFVQVAPNGFDNIMKRKIFTDQEFNKDLLSKITWVNSEVAEKALAGNFGLRDMYFDEVTKEMKPAQILLPNIFRKYFSNKTNITIEDLKKAGLHEVFLMRSPYQLASGFSAEIVGFLPASEGEIIVVPHEAMDRIGFDFDVDKLYAYIHSASFTPDGPVKARYTTSDRDLDYRYREYVKEKVFSMLENDEVADELKEGLVKEFRDVVDSIVKGRVRAIMLEGTTKNLGEAIDEAKAGIGVSIDTLQSPKLAARVRDIYENNSPSKASSIISNLVSSYVNRQDSEALKNTAALQKVNAEMLNLVTLTNKADAVYKVYRDMIRDAAGYEDLKKTLTYEIRETLTDYAIESGVAGEKLMTKQQFASLPIERQNSKKARNNAILDMFMSVYSRPEIMYKLLTSNSEKPLQDAVDAIGKEVADASPLSITEQDRLFSVNRASKSGIAIASTWVTFQEVLQNNKVKLRVWKETEDGVELVNAGVKFLNKKNELMYDVGKKDDANIRTLEGQMMGEYADVGMYSIKTRGITQDLVAKYMLILQTAAVDNVKNQTMSPANLNDYTLPTAMYLGAVGIDDMNIVVRFLRQPVVMAYTELRNSGLSHKEAVYKLYAQLGSRVKALKGTPVKVESSAKYIKAFSSERMLEMIKQDVSGEKDITFYNDQLEILNKWDVYTNNASTLGTAASNANFDTKKLGKNYHEVKTRSEGYRNIKADVSFINLDKIFDNNVIGEYYEKGVIPAHTMFNHPDLLPYGYGLYGSVYKKYEKNVAGVRSKIDEKSRRELHKNILAFVASYDNGISSVSERERLLNLPKEVAKLKEAMPNNLLLSRIDVELARHLNKNHYVMRFRRIGLDDAEMKFLINSFTELLDNPVTANTARDMIKYTLLFHGISQSRDSLINVIPPSFLLNSPYGNTYKSSAFVKEMNDSVNADVFFAQFAAHHPEKLNYVTVKKNQWRGTNFILAKQDLEENVRDFVQVQYKGKPHAAMKIAETDSSVEYAILQNLGTEDLMEYSFSEEASLFNPLVPMTESTLSSGYVNLIDEPQIESIEEQVVTEEGISAVEQSIPSPSEYTNHSGGAKGYDAEWDIIGAEFGMVNNKHYLLPIDGEVADPRLKAKGVKPVDATRDIGPVSTTGPATGEAQIAVTNAERIMGRIEPNHVTRNTKKIRNYAQVKNADAVFAIGSLIPKGADITIAKGQTVKKALVPQVNGGTSVAVQLGIMMNKPTYVFNQVANANYPQGWYKWDNNKKDFVAIETPTLTKNFAGIGTSSNTTEQGKQAIRDVYELTFRGSSAVSEVKTTSQKEKVFTPANKEQEEAITKIQEFVKQGKANEWFTVIGKAGTGKTTIVQEAIAPFVGKKSIVIAALAHKAKDVLSQKLNKRFPDNPVPAFSIAKLLGLEFNMETGEFTKPIPAEGEIPSDPPIAKAEIIIIDEASMINEEALEIIMSEKKSSAKVIFLGDSGQLPPIRKNESDAISPVFNGQNQTSLYERVRQGEESPILPYADFYWENSHLENPVKNPAPAIEDKVSPQGALVKAKTFNEVLKVSIPLFKKAVEESNPDIIKAVVYRNQTRDLLNNYIRREVFGKEASEYEKGDILMLGDKYTMNAGEEDAFVLENATQVVVEDAYSEIENGLEVWNVSFKDIPGFAKTLTAASKKVHQVRVTKMFADARNLMGRARKDAMAKAWAEARKYAKLDYAYAITSHKSQGSTYNTVIVGVEDIMGVTPTTNATKSRAIYTAITRASTTAIVVNGQETDMNMLTEAIGLSSARLSGGKSTAPAAENIAGIEIFSKAPTALGKALTNVHYAKNGKTEFDIIPSDKSLKLTPLARQTWGQSVEAWYKSNKAETKKIPKGPEADAYDMKLMVGLITDKLVQYPDLVAQITQKGGLKFLALSEHNVGTGRWSSKNEKNMFMNALKQAYQNAINRVQNKPEAQETPLANVDEIFAHRKEVLRMSIEAGGLNLNERLGEATKKELLKLLEQAETQEQLGEILKRIC